MKKTAIAAMLMVSVMLLGYSANAEVKKNEAKSGKTSQSVTTHKSKESKSTLATNSSKKHKSSASQKSTKHPSKGEKANPTKSHASLQGNKKESRSNKSSMMAKNERNASVNRQVRDKAPAGEKLSSAKVKPQNSSRHAQLVKSNNVKRNPGSKNNTKVHRESAKRG